MTQPFVNLLLIDSNAHNNMDSIRRPSKQSCTNSNNAMGEDVKKDFLLRTKADMGIYEETSHFCNFPSAIVQEVTSDSWCLRDNTLNFRYCNEEEIIMLGTLILKTSCSFF